MAFIIDDIISGVLGSNAAGDAADAQAAAAREAQRYYRNYLRDAQVTLSPYNMAGQWALEQLVGSDALNAGSTPEGQAQLAAGEAYSGGGFKMRPGGTWEDKVAWIAKNRQSLETLLPPGMHVEDIPQYGKWIKNPVPVDRYGTPLKAGTGTTGGTQGLLAQGAPEFNFQQYQESPWYQLPLQEGNRGIEQSAAARGGLFSGATGKALSQYNQDYAYSKYLPARQQEFYEWVSGKLNPLLSMAGLGQTTASQMSGNALQTGQQMGQAAQYQGEAKASGYLGQANALSTMYGNIGNTIATGVGFLAGGLGGGVGGAAAGGAAPSIGSAVGGGAANDYGLSQYRMNW